MLLSKHSGGLPLHVVLAYFFDAGILISCCPMSNLALWQPFSVLCSLLALFCFVLFLIFNGGLSTYTIFFLLVVGFPEKIIIISHEIILDAFYLKV